MNRLKPGIKLNNAYVIKQDLSNGGFANTYEAIDSDTGLRVCIKELIVSDENVQNLQELKNSFIREGKVLKSFHDPSIVGAYDYFEENGTCYIVLEYLDGKTLEEYVKQNGIMPAEEMFSAVMPLLKALDALHTKDLLHLDIAPNNIMAGCKQETGNDAESLVLTLFDFGTVRNKENHNALDTVKDGYSPVEQTIANDKPGAYTDIYSLCATMWFCLTGERPQAAQSRLLDDELESPSEMGIKIAPGLEAILMKGLAVEPSKRYQSAREMSDAIQKELPIISQVNNKRRIKCIAAGGVVAAAIIAAAGIGISKKNAEDVYDPERMYQVTLTPDDEFTVAGYHDSIKTLEDRLEIFSDESGKYDLSENEGVVTLLLNKSDFQEHAIEEDDSKRGGTIETAAVPEYVLRAYLSRASKLTLVNTGTSEMLPIDQTEDIDVKMREGLIPAAAGFDSGSSEDGGVYFDISFTESFLNENEERLNEWSDQYALKQDMDCSPQLTPFQTVPKEDGSGFYLLDVDDGSYAELLYYNLTHAPLEHSFDIWIDEQVAWQEDEKDYGRYQITDTELKESDQDVLAYYFYGQMSEGEHFDCINSIRNRMDALKVPYSIGEMDCLTGVTPGADAPIYAFTGVETPSEKTGYADLIDLMINSNHFYLTAEDGTEVELYPSSVVSIDEKGLAINRTIDDTLSGQKIWLTYGDQYGSDRILLMEADISAVQMEDQESGTVVFSRFANGNDVDTDNAYIIDLIAACIENRPQEDLLPYDIQVKEAPGEPLLSLGLFVER